jgi:hypothetical protein
VNTVFQWLVNEDYLYFTAVFLYFASLIHIFWLFRNVVLKAHAVLKFYLNVVYVPEMIFCFSKCVWYVGHCPSSGILWNSAFQKLFLHPSGTKVPAQSCHVSSHSFTCMLHETFKSLTPCGLDMCGCSTMEHLHILSSLYATFWTNVLWAACQAVIYQQHC